MPFPFIFDASVTEQCISRVNKLTPLSQPLWGKMDVAQMLAHLCVAYEMVYENRHKKPGVLARWMLTKLVKPSVVGDRPYRKNSRTAPAFLIADPRHFDTEKQRLIVYLQRVQRDGVEFFHQRESHSFGPLSANEWSAMFYKHLDYHLSQFQV